MIIADAFAGLIERRATKQTGGSLASPPRWLTGLGGTESASGVVVNHQTALTSASFWRGVGMISADVAKIPLNVYRRVDAGGREKDPSHPAYSLLRRKPNPEMTAFYFKQTLTAHALQQGNGYGLIERENSGRPTAIWPLSPLSTYPIRMDGVLWYVVTRGDTGEIRKVQASDILHIKGLGFDGLVGYDVITFLKDVLGQGLAMQSYGAAFFKNHAVAGIILEHPSNLSEDAQTRLKKSFDQLLVPLDKKFSTKVLEEGMTAKVISVDARGSQLIQQREFTIREVANVLGVPPHKLGDTTRTAFASLEQENQSYLDDALDRWFTAWETEAGLKLLTESENVSETHFFEFVRAAVVRTDLKTRFEAYNAAIERGWMLRDEARAMENWEPLPDGRGKKVLRPANLVVEDDEDKSDPDAEAETRSAAPPPRSDDDENDEDRSAALLSAHRAMAESVARRFHRRVGHHAIRAAGKPDRFVTWIDEKMVPEHRDVLVDGLRPIVACLEATGRSIGPDGAEKAIDDYLASVRESLLTAAECKASELVWRVEAWVTLAESQVGGQVWERMVTE